MVFTTQFGPDFGGDPQHAQASGMAALVIGRKLRGIVLLLVEETQRDQPPIDLVPCLGRHFGNPAGRDPGKGADRVPEEFDVIVSAYVAFLARLPPTALRRSGGVVTPDLTWDYTVSATPKGCDPSDHLDRPPHLLTFWIVVWHWRSG